MSEVKRWQPEIVYDGKTPRISKREWVHGIYVEHTDYDALEQRFFASNREIARLEKRNVALEQVARGLRDALRETVEHAERAVNPESRLFGYEKLRTALAAADALEDK